MVSQGVVQGNFQTLSVKLDARGVLTVALNRPDVRNAFNETLIAELTEVFGRRVLENDVRLVVFTGEGTVFSAGGDLNWMKKSIELSFAGNLEDTQRLTAMFRTMNECPKPVIGAIHGAAIGGGVGLTAICDIAIATRDTQFSLSEVRLGIVPACIGPFVISKIGASHARALFMSAERFQAPRAKEVGLIHGVVEDRVALDVEIERVVANMLQCGPHAMAAAKKLVLDLSWAERREAVGDTLDYVARMLAELRVSPEGQEGLKAFLEKRKPNWIR
ncbi:MAG: enoyl-CoA hydratase/isomerase family protein [Bdellovibrionales bacterium]|nr:enoyl-CoA hydratase/isomerase family protein [Bdellovibrionales bacterium]